MKRLDYSHELQQHALELARKTGVPHTPEGTVDFEHPHVKSVLEMIDSGEIKAPEFKNDAAKWRWAREKKRALDSIRPAAPPPAPKIAEWTTPDNLAVHADKHGGEFGGADNYTALEEQLAETAPEDMRPFNRRCKGSYCTTAYHSPSMGIVHVKDDTGKTVSLFKRLKAPLPTLSAVPPATAE
jgi:hypothetical protein